MTLGRVYGGQNFTILNPTGIFEAVENRQIISRMNIKMCPSTEEVKGINMVLLTSCQSFNRKNTLENLTNHLFVLGK